jgi:hypothetical protein
MTKIPTVTYTYRDVIVTRNSNPAGLKWQCYCNGTFIYADTLAGIKGLIKGQLT